MEHYLKCWPQYLSEIQSGRKTFEVRNASDRIFQAGDQLTLQAWCPEKCQYLGYDPYTVDVLAVYHNLPGIQPDHVVMSIRPAQRTIHE